MKKLTGTAMALIVLGMVVSATANAQIQLPKPIPTTPVPNCTVPKVDGDKVPFPLKNANTKFELAENETYVLNGYIVTDQGRTYFKVDFESQPWLATPKRVQFPYFPVSPSDAAKIKASSSDLVQVAVVARKADVSTQGQEWSNNIMLDVITKPVPLTR